MKRLSRWAVWVLVSIAVSLGVLTARGFFAETGYAARLSDLCDALFVPGILLLCAAGLVFVADDGVFDFFGWTARRLIRLLRFQRPMDEEGDPKTFYDYRQMKHGGRRTDTRPLLLIAAVDLALAGVFLLMYLPLEA